MRKYILLLVCLMTLPVFSQYVEKDVYEGVTISQDHHMTVCGVSMGLDVHTFENKMKQKGFVVSNQNYDYYSDFGLKGKLLGMPYGFIDIITSSNSDIIKRIHLWKKYKISSQAYNCFNVIKNNVNKIYSSKTYSERIFSYGDNSKKIIINWDIFSSDKSKIIGNISLSTYLGNTTGEHEVELCIMDIPSNFSNERYTCQIYDISKYVSFHCTSGYLFIYPTYGNMTLKPKGKDYFVHFEADEDILKVVNNNEFSDVEKNLIFSRGIQGYGKSISSLSNKYYYNNLDGYIYNASIDYKNEKRKHLAAQQQQSQGMTSGEAMFEIWEGTANVQKYKKDGTYQARLKNFINTWNAIAGGGSGGGTNWDNLNDAQKAVIHQNDNGR